MSYLAKLKREIASQSTADRPSEGFEGDRGMGVCPEMGDGSHIFTTGEEERSINQFFTQAKARGLASEEPSDFQQTRVGQSPSKPPKGTPDTSASWRDRFYLLSSVNAACPGFRGHSGLEWRHIFDAACRFLERHADAAHALGWSALDLFAVHETVGATRVDACGALMVGAGAIVDRVERDLIHFARNGQPRGRFFRTTPSPEAVLVWDFKRTSEILP